jgi:hypothetical protein
VKYTASAFSCSDGVLSLDIDIECSYQPDRSQYRTYRRIYEQVTTVSVDPLPVLLPCKETCTGAAKTLKSTLPLFDSPFSIVLKRSCQTIVIRFHRRQQRLSFTETPVYLSRLLDATGCSTSASVCTHDSRSDPATQPHSFGQFRPQFSLHP